MKDKKNIKELAQEVASLEKILQDSNTEDKTLQSAIHRIEEIIDNLSPKEVLELDDYVLNILRQ